MESRYYPGVEADVIKLMTELRDVFDEDFEVQNMHGRLSKHTSLRKPVAMFRRCRGDAGPAARLRVPVQLSVPDAVLICARAYHAQPVAPFRLIRTHDFVTRAEKR